MLAERLVHLFRYWETSEWNECSEIDGLVFSERSKSFYTPFDETPFYRKQERWAVLLFRMLEVYSLG
jgi:hypothetical protein